MASLIKMECDRVNRNEKLLRMREKGATYWAIGLAFDVSTDWARVCCEHAREYREERRRDFDRVEAIIRSEGERAERERKAKALGRE